MLLNKKAFANIIAGLCDLYGKTPSEFIFDIYYETFKDYSSQQLSGAIGRCLRERKYNSLPKPAEILEFLEGTKDDKALMAWLGVKDAVKKIGYYQTPDFADPIISHCINEFGGWMEFCSIEKDELPFIEKRFLDLYRLFLKREVDKPLGLIGFINLKNIERGHPETPAVKYGYDKKLLKHFDNSKNVY